MNFKDKEEAMDADPSYSLFLKYAPLLRASNWQKKESTLEDAHVAKTNRKSWPQIVVLYDRVSVLKLDPKYSAMHPGVKRRVELVSSLSLMLPNAVEESAFLTSMTLN